MHLNNLEPVVGFAPEMGLLVATLEHSTRQWQMEIESAPDQLVKWRPFPNTQCAGALMLHLAACERWWIDKAIGGLPIDESELAVAYDLTMDQYNGIWPEPPDEPLAWYLDVLAQHRKRSLDVLRQEQDINRVIVQSCERSFTVGNIVARIINHDSYHGGQIVLLSSLMEQESKR